MVCFSINAEALLSEVFKFVSYIDRRWGFGVYAGPSPAEQRAAMAASSCVVLARSRNVIR
jgi:hypothetical protein